MHCKSIVLCVTILLVIVFSTTVFSTTVFSQEFDPGKTGSVSVTLTQQHNKEPVIGAELSVYFVAKVCMNTNGNLSYVYTDLFKNSGIDIDDPYLATKLDLFVLDNNVSSIKMTTDANGTAICKDLEMGLYFIKQTSTAEGFACCTPFMVTIPGKNAEGYVYNVNASPKTEVTRLTSITIKKVWNTDESTAATDSVNVQLIRNGNVVKTATLNAKNNWQVTYTDMPESDAYNIKEINIPKGFTATYSKTGNVFTVTNTSTLIQTGQLLWPIFVLSIGGMLLIVVGISLLQKKRKTNA